MNARGWLSILLSICLLTGCASPFSDSLDYTRIYIEEGGDTLGLTPDFSYKVPSQTPHILVNQVGYSPSDSKQAILKGTGISGEFQVLTEAGERVVLRGTLENLGREGEESLYGADFSELQAPGRYLLFHPDLGYSDVFVIAEGVYETVTKALLQEMEQQESESTLELCYEIASLLLAEEFYGKEGIYRETLAEVLDTKIEALLRAQDVTTGAVSGVIPENITAEQMLQDISLSATAGFAGVMAMYAGYLQSTEYRYAGQCTMAGEKAYRFMENSLDIVNYDLGYFAAAQMYRRTGRARYATALQLYLPMKKEQRQISAQDFSLFGDVAYLNTNFKTNLEYSRQIINGLMQEAEEISGACSRMSFYVSEDREAGDIRGMLQDAMKIGVVNYVIANHEYSSILQNYLHYFLGRNEGALCYAAGSGARNPEVPGTLMAGNENGAMLYFLLQSIR